MFEKLPKEDEYKKFPVKKIQRSYFSFDINGYAFNCVCVCVRENAYLFVCNIILLINVFFSYSYTEFHSF